AAASRGMGLRPDRTPVLRQAGKPTLIITGEHDALMPLSTSEAMAEAAPGSSLVVLPHAGHLSNMEDPEGFNKAVTDFLRALPGDWSARRFRGSASGGGRGCFARRGVRRLEVTTGLHRVQDLLQRTQSHGLRHVAIEARVRGPDHILRLVAPGDSHDE